MDLYGTTKEQLGWLALNSRAQRRAEPARGLPGADDDGPVPRRARRLRPRSACSTATSRSTARSRWSCPRADYSTTAAAPRCASKPSAEPPARRLDRAPRLPAHGRQSTPPPRCGRAPTCTGRHRRRRALRRLHLPGARMAGGARDLRRRARPDRSSRAASASHATARCRSTPTADSCPPGGCTATGCSTKRASSCAGWPATRQLPRRPEVAVVSAGGGPIAGCMFLTC